MERAGVDVQLVREAILARKGGAEKLLPFRYMAPPGMQSSSSRSSIAQCSSR
jgi:hypothetical protein